jgi:hypothetical protein
MRYNFVRINSAVKMTPAMAPRIETRLWEMSDLAELVEAQATAPKRRATYRKKGEIMGKRSGVLDRESDIAKLTDKELAAEISRCETRKSLAETAYLRKSFTNRIHWLIKVQRRRAEENSN